MALIVTPLKKKLHWNFSGFSAGVWAWEAEEGGDVVDPGVEGPQAWEPPHWWGACQSTNSQGTFGETRRRILETV